MAEDKVDGSMVVPEGVISVVMGSEDFPSRLWYSAEGNGQEMFGGVNIEVRGCKTID